MADLVQIDALDTGSYNQSGGHVTSNENYIAGQLTGVQNRNFFVFDLAGVSGVITGATLNLYNPGNLGPCCNGFVSPDATETFSLFDVSTPTDTLITGGAGLVSIFDDLGSGTNFGQHDVSAADNDTVVQISLNAAAIAALNAAIGDMIAFGGMLESLSGPANQYIFGFSTVSFALDDVRRLDLTVQSVPEPASFALLCVGGIFVAGQRFRRKRGCEVR
jgi:PEP-CTERM motif